MKLKAKIVLLVSVSLVILGFGMFLVAADRIANGIYDEAYVGMNATTLAIRDIFEQGNDGPYRLDENGDFWKGESLNISQAYEIVDHIKENTGMDVTVFWQDTRMLTSLVNAQGERQINTQASAEVAQAVLEEGRSYQNRNVDILGSEYIVNYIPIFQEGTDETVGMVFLGTPQETVSDIINRVRLQLLIVVVVVLLATVFVTYFVISRIVQALRKSMGLLTEISDGKLNLDVDAALLKRKDEVGDLGRTVLLLKDKLHNMIGGIRESSDLLSRESLQLKNVSDEVYQAMQEVDRSAQQMGISCGEQASDATTASENVTSMGAMIEENGAELQKLNEISQNIHEVSISVVKQFKELNQMVETVSQSMGYLSQQTSATNESVARIDSATELITSIASQTKLLSLNASIEAARAGEHGKGFAVVAEEIQELAIQSNTAANEIHEIVETLNNNSKNTVQRMEEVQVAIEKQETDIRKTTDAFRSMRDGVAQSVAYMEQVMNKSRKLEEVRIHTVDVVQNSAALSQENAASIQLVSSSVDMIFEQLGKISKNTDYLRKLSSEMDKSISVFQG